MVPGLHAVRVEHVDMLAYEAIEVDHVKEPAALRTAPGPAATNQQTRVDAPVDDCAVVESEDTLDIPQAQPSPFIQRDCRRRFRRELTPVAVRLSPNLPLSRTAMSASSSVPTSESTNASSASVQRR